MVEAVNASALNHPGAVGTVGLMEVKPGSPNVVPGEVFFTIDLRDPEAETLDQMEVELATATARIIRECGVEIDIKTIWNQPAQPFDQACVAAVQRAAEASGFTSRTIMSAAGHDAAYVARVAPAAMIFVPCRDGISHNEAEYTSKEQCAAGAQVLLQAVLDYDRQLAERFGWR
jgi:N-carbamoyl-L-amino-acid hydrolase